MNCPGSVALLKELKLPESDEPDYRVLGTVAHLVASECLMSGEDAWEWHGKLLGDNGDIEVDDAMVNAVQMYLDECRSLIALEAKLYVEHAIDAPDFHHQFYGTTDFGCVVADTLFIRDFKYGEGIAVDVEWNSQIMYYAFGILRHHPEVTKVDLGIVQPRGFHGDGPIRRWSIEADSIRVWAQDTLKPAMDRTELDASLDPGPWCRFCPAKLVCPMMTALFGAACNADPRTIINLSDKSLGRSYQHVQAVKFYLKAMEEETMRRLMTGSGVPGTKLVNKKANRVWKDGAEEFFCKEFTMSDVLTQPAFKSPTAIEALGNEAKKLVREWAYTPNTGYTVVLESDKRPAVKPQTSQEAFAHMAESTDG